MKTWQFKFPEPEEVQSLFSLHPCSPFVTRVRANFTRFFALADSLQQHLIADNIWKEKVLKDFVNAVAKGVLESGAGKFYGKLVNQRPRDILGQTAVR